MRYQLSSLCRFFFFAGKEINTLSSEQIRKSTLGDTLYGLRHILRAHIITLVHLFMWCTPAQIWRGLGYSVGESLVQSKLPIFVQFSPN